jgi:hypothetical protein
MMGIEWRSKWRGRNALFVEVDPVVVLTTSVTTTTRMLPVLANTTVTGGNVSPLLSVLAQAGGLKTSEGREIECGLIDPSNPSNEPTSMVIRQRHGSRREHLSLSNTPHKPL